MCNKLLINTVQLDDKVLEFQQEIETYASKISHFLNNLKEYESVRNKKMKRKLKSFNLEEVLIPVYHILERIASKRQITISYQMIFEDLE